MTIQAADHPDKMPVVLLSGLAAGPSVFMPQSVQFDQLIVPEWPKPQRRDNLESYAKRIANGLADAGIGGPLIIGGASFGGMLAQFVAPHVDARAIVLIGSVRGPEELPLQVKAARILTPLVGLVPVRAAQWMCQPLISPRVRKLAAFLSGLSRQFIHCDARVFKWSLAALLRWRTRPEPACPVYHIHGKRDLVLPCWLTTPSQTIDEGGHLISLTHPIEVNAFLHDVIARSAD